MSNNPYDQAEAKVLFARSHAKRDPIKYYQDRVEAANGLLDAVLLAAKEAGYLIEQQGGTVVIAHPGQGVVFIEVEDDVLRARRGHRGAVDESRSFPIEYDGGVKMFVGQDEDSFFVQEPGKPKKRRSAVAVVAEVIGQMIDEQAEARRASR